MGHAISVYRNQNFAIVKGKVVPLPPMYVVKLSKRLSPSDDISGTGLDRIDVGQYVSKNGCTGTSDLAEARVFYEGYHFPWEDMLVGEYFKPLEVEKVVRLKK